MKRSRVGLLSLSAAVIVTAVLILMPFQRECGSAAFEAFSKDKRSGIEYVPSKYTNRGGAGDRLAEYERVPSVCAFRARQRLWIGGGVMAIGLVAFVLLRGGKPPQT